MWRWRHHGSRRPRRLLLCRDRLVTANAPCAIAKDSDVRGSACRETIGVDTSILYLMSCKSSLWAKIVKLVQKSDQDPYTTISPDEEKNHQSARIDSSVCWTSLSTGAARTRAAVLRVSDVIQFWKWLYHPSLGLTPQRVVTARAFHGPVSPPATLP